MGCRGIVNPGVACFIIAALQIIARCIMPAFWGDTLGLGCCKSDVCVDGLAATKAIIAVLQALIAPGDTSPLSLMSNPCVEDLFSNLIVFARGAFLWFKMACSLDFFTGVITALDGKPVGIWWYFVLLE